MSTGGLVSGDEPTGIYEPLKAPFQHLTATNRGPIAFVTAVALIVITSLTVLVKMYTTYTAARKLAWNDVTMLAAAVSPAQPQAQLNANDQQAFGMAYTICICLAVDNRLGTISQQLG